MPIYSYRCQSCGVEFDKMQKFSDKPLTRCPECRTGQVRRLVQPPAIVFKGSGWYATDHRSTSRQSSEKKADSENTGDKTDKAEKADSKAAKKETGTPKSDD